jgi:general L-amino acid transport system permease protein
LIGFAITALGSDVWPYWLMAAALIAGGNWVGQRLPRARSIAYIGWVLSFPIALILISGLPFLSILPIVPPNLWGGLLLTLMLTVVGNFLSLPLGILLALGRRSKLPAFRYFSIGYIELIRGVPLITILHGGQYAAFFLPKMCSPIW